MNPHRVYHRRFFNKRQGLGGVIGGLFGSGSTSNPVSQSTTVLGTPESTSDAQGVSGVVSSLVDNIPTVVVSSSEPSSTTVPSIPLTYPPSSSTGSTTRLTSQVTTFSTSPATPTPISPSTVSTTPTATLTPVPAPSVSDTVYASSEGTRIVYITSTLPTTSASAATTTSFLQTPALEGGVFALVGVVILIIAFVAVTWVIRRRRRNRLERDTAVAVTFDPGATNQYERQESMEKHRLSRSSSDHSHGYGYDYGIGPVYAPRREYHGPVGYGQHATAAYSMPADPVPYQASSLAVPQPIAQGQDGANLKRKFSDRKPVPPLLPSPPHDPSNVRVSIPPQFSPQ